MTDNELLDLELKCGSWNVNQQIDIMRALKKFKSDIQQAREEAYEKGKAENDEAYEAGYNNGLLAQNAEE